MIALIRCTETKVQRIFFCSFLTGGAPVCGCGKAMQLFYIYKLIKVYHIH